MANEIATIDESVWDLLRLAGTLDEKRKHIYLRVLAETANPKIAAESAGYKTTGAVNRLMKEDESFRAAVIEAAEAGGDMIEAEAVRRGVNGVKKAVYYKGEIIDYEFVYSDSLLQMLLKAAKPQKYAERQHRTVEANINVGVAVLPMAAPSLEAWEKEAIDVHDRQKLYEDPMARSDKPKEIEGEFTVVKRA